MTTLIKLKVPKYATVLVTLMLSSFICFSQSYLGVPYTALNLTNYTTTTGTVGAVGSTYLYPNAGTAVINGVTKNIDVRVTLVAKSITGVSPTQFNVGGGGYTGDGFDKVDINSSQSMGNGAPFTGGNNDYFQPGWNWFSSSATTTLLTGLTTAETQWRFDFFEAGTSIPAYLNVIPITIDNDGTTTPGTIDLKEQVVYSPAFTSSVLSSPTNETQAGTTFTGPNSNQAGIGITPPYNAYTYYYNISGFNWTARHPSQTTAGTFNLSSAARLSALALNPSAIPTTNVPNFSAANISGTVFNDINGLTDNTVNGTGTGLPSGQNLYATLIDPATGLVVASTRINADGTYNFNGVPQGATYQVQISTNISTVGQIPAAVALPAGWANTGENNGTGTGSDGTVNGRGASFTTPVTPNSITSFNNVNFGIQQLPESAVNLQPTVGNPGGFNSQSVPAGAFQTSNVGVNPNTQDYSGGTVSSIRITAFPSNANSITINGVVYTNGGTCPPATTCTPWPVGGVTVPYTNGVGPAQAISVDPVEGNVDVVIPFVSIDNAGVEDPTPGSVTVPFRTITLIGTVFNDLNGNAPTNGSPEGGEAVINGTNTGGGITTGAPLFANLIDANGKVIATAPILSDGTYNFPNVPQNATGLSVQVSTNQGVVGQNKPVTALPSSWVTTGENKNGQAGSADPGANGEIPITTATTNITQQNFGIQQLPESAVNSQVIGLNPGGTVNTTVTPSWFENSNVGANPNTQDYSGGTVTSIRITAFPSNATSITINGVTYTSATWPVGGVTVPYTPGVGPTQPITVDPVDGIVNVVIPFVSIDNAGQADPTPGSVTLIYGATLPVRLASFTAQPQNSGVVLTWVVEAETDVANYAVEYSTNGINFTSIGTKAATGSRNYSMLHSTPQQGLNYYRLKVIDRDGKVGYSDVRKVNFGKADIVNVFPIPAHTEVNVTLPGSLINKGVILSIIAMDGKVVISKQVAVASQTETLDVHTLASGRYMVRIASGTTLLYQNIAVMR